MKYSTSPVESRCHSPVSLNSGDSGDFCDTSSLPMPVTHRNHCIGAATKCYKYLRKLIKFDQMDFEFAMWQMIFLFIAPQKIYRNFQSRKQTKSQFARDDPAFLVLFSLWLFIASLVIGLVLHLRFWQFVKLSFLMLAVDYVATTLLVATTFWFIANRYMRYDKTQDLEWGYAFDIHLNAFFPSLIILHIFLPIIYNGFVKHYGLLSCFVGNTFWFIAACYYIYITFLGYANVNILHKTSKILGLFPILFLIYITTLCARINITRISMNFYHDRV